MKTWFAALALIVVPTAAQAQTVAIARGEAVTLTQDDGGVWGVDRRAAPDLSPYEADSAARFARGDFDAAVGPKSMSTFSADTPKPERGKIVLHFVRTPGKDHSLLVLENGYDSGMVYRATMRIAGKAQPTDVCLVKPRGVSREYWPYAIDALQLSDIRLTPWKDGDPVPCE